MLIRATFPKVQVKGLGELEVTVSTSEFLDLRGNWIRFPLLEIHTDDEFRGLLVPKFLLIVPFLLDDEDAVNLLQDHDLFPGLLIPVPADPLMSNQIGPSLPLKVTPLTRVHFISAM
jgi:hypothetical protein